MKASTILCAILFALGLSGCDQPGRGDLVDAEVAQREEQAETPARRTPAEQTVPPTEDTGEMAEEGDRATDEPPTP